MPATQVTGMTFGKGMRNPTVLSGCYNWVSRFVGDQPALKGQITVHYRFKYISGTSGKAVFRYQNGNNYTLTPFESISASEHSWSLEVRPYNTQFALAFSINTVLSGSTLVFNYGVTKDTNEHHVAVTYNPSGLAKLYYDGVEVSSITAPVSNLSSNADTIIITSNGTETTSNFTIDNVQPLSGIATPAQILNWFNNGI